MAPFLCLAGQQGAGPLADSFCALVWGQFGGDTSCTPDPVKSTRKDVLLFTPQRLFGEVGSSPEILTHEPFLERARLQREQERDGLARLALGGYVVARLVDKFLLLGTDGDEGEGFRWQLEAVRRHVDDLPSDVPETAHLIGVAAAVPKTRRRSPALWMSLTAYAYFLEHEGRLEEALEMVTLAARAQGEDTAPPDFVGYALLAGRLNRLLTRWDVASHCYFAAYEAASTIGDFDRALRARLGKAHILRGSGNLPKARHEVEDVIARATELGLIDVQSDAYQDLGNILTLLGNRDEALESIYRAFQLCHDPVNQMRILGDLGYALNESVHYDAARVALEIVAGSAASHHVRVNALLELMQLESAVGNRVVFERRRLQVREMAAQMTPSTTIDFRYKTGIGLARFGQIERAREALSEGLALAQRHRLNEWYFRIERMLKSLASPQDQIPDITAAAEAIPTPAVRRMTAGMREYSSSIV